MNVPTEDQIRWVLSHRAEIQTKLSDYEANALESISGRAQYGLSEKQVAFWNRLWNKAQGTSAKTETPLICPKVAAWLEGVGLQRPCLSLQGWKIQKGGPYSKYPNHYHVTQQGVYKGRFKTNGEWDGYQAPPIWLTTLERHGVQKVLAQAMLEDTLSHCCFCARALTDETSRLHGYGPTCAENYGLPY